MECFRMFVQFWKSFIFSNEFFWFSNADLNINQKYKQRIFTSEKLK